MNEPDKEFDLNPNKVIGVLDARSFGYYKICLKSVTAET